jgi:hypothetical protein
MELCMPIHPLFGVNFKNLPMTNRATITIDSSILIYCATTCSELLPLTLRLEVEVFLAIIIKTQTKEQWGRD